MESPSTRSSLITPHATEVTLEIALCRLRDQAGRTLGELADEQPLLVCLLRHNGCTFCRETIAELAKQRQSIEAAGMAIAVVGMSDSVASLAALGHRFGLSGVRWIADPDRFLYRALNVGRGTLPQLLGPRVLWAGLRGIFGGYGLGRPEGDPFQLPGTVVIHRGRVLRQYVHRSAADRPVYAELACNIES